MKTQSIEVANRINVQFLDAETLMKNKRFNLKLVQGAKKYKEEGKRNSDAEAKIIEWEANELSYSRTPTNNNERIVSRELIGTKINNIGEWKEI